MKKLFLGLIIVTHTVLFGQAEKSIKIGPYVQNVTPETAVICWATLANQVQIQSPAGKTDTLNEYEHHEMILANLADPYSLPVTILLSNSSLLIIMLY